LISTFNFNTTNPKTKKGPSKGLRINVLILVKGLGETILAENGDYLNPAILTRPPLDPQKIADRLHSEKKQKFF
jgi:hypothetical protein